MKRVLVFAYGIGWIIGAGGCEKVKKIYSHSEVIAEAEGEKLTREMLASYLPKNLSPEDSVSYTSFFINNWVKQTIISHKAKKELPDMGKKIQYKLDAYKNSLLIYEYENYILSQRLDTAVTSEEVQTYYMSHQNDFQLRQPVVKCKFIKIKKDPVDAMKIRKWIFSDRDSVTLKKFAMQKAHKYSLDTAWHYLNEMLQLLPTKYPSDDKFLGSRTYIENEDEEFLYFFYITYKKYSNEIAPLSFVQSEIVNIILNQRRKKIIDEFEKKTLDDAKLSGAIKIKLPPPTETPADTSADSTDTR